MIAVNAGIDKKYYHSDQEIHNGIKFFQYDDNTLRSRQSYDQKGMQK